MKILGYFVGFALLLLLLLAIVALYYFFFFYPFSIAAERNVTIWNYIVFSIIWATLFSSAIGNVAIIAANVYGVKKYNISTWYLPRQSELYKDVVEKELSKGATIKAMILSYVFFIIWFALTYFCLGNQLKGMFDQPTVKVVDAFYLSFTAISVGPAGLNPTATPTKCLVMLEIAVGLIYTITVFSVLVELLRHKE